LIWRSNFSEIVRSVSELMPRRRRLTVGRSQPYGNTMSATVVGMISPA